MKVSVPVRHTRDQAAAVKDVLAFALVTPTGHKMISPNDLQWSDVPSLPAGAKIAVIEGPMSEAVSGRTVELTWNALATASTWPRASCRWQAPVISW